MRFIPHRLVIGRGLANLPERIHYQVHQTTGRFDTCAKLLASLVGYNQKRFVQTVRSLLYR